MKHITNVFLFYVLSILTGAAGSTAADAQVITWYGTGALNSNTSGVGNEAFGGNALYWNTGGSQNVAYGYDALAYNITGGYNLAVGSYSLLLNTTGSYNNANGFESMYYNTTGKYNVALGSYSLFSNTTGGYNSALGYIALYKNTTGQQNTGFGTGALYTNTTGSYNSASGSFGLHDNTTGSSNNASGYGALYKNTTGVNNNAMGVFAMGSNTTGSNNIAMGQYSGYNAVTGSNNIEIGSRGSASDNNVIRLGSPGTQAATYVAGVSGVNVTGGATVVVNSLGQLGVVSSSRRYKEDIRSMGDASDRLLALRPVTFKYKKADENGQKPEQYGLIAEEVAKVMPELVVYNQKGQPETVAYQTLAPLLLNELQREHREVAALQAEVVALRRVTEQLTAHQEESRARAEPAAQAEVQP
jgi:hypothetical protein